MGPKHWHQAAPVTSPTLNSEEAFVFDHQQGSHAFYRHPATKRTTVVPIHSKELPRWLLKKIIKEAGLTEDEFRKLL
jgi:predicted RNA binding protein YcfA (HicA-like mRNA interferase family)